jgi:hypothetical protein
LQVVAKIAAGLKHLPQPFVISNIVANQISRAHNSGQIPNWPIHLRPVSPMRGGNPRMVPIDCNEYAMVVGDLVMVLY